MKMDPELIELAGNTGRDDTVALLQRGNRWLVDARRPTIRVRHRHFVFTKRLELTGEQWPPLETWASADEARRALEDITQRRQRSRDRLAEMRKRRTEADWQIEDLANQRESAAAAIDEHLRYDAQRFQRLFTAPLQVTPDGAKQRSSGKRFLRSGNTFELFVRPDHLPFQPIALLICDEYGCDTLFAGQTPPPSLSKVDRLLHTLGAGLTHAALETAFSALQTYALVETVLRAKLWRDFIEDLAVLDGKKKWPRA
jgi:hypothetical protein